MVFRADLQCSLAGFGSGSSFFFFCLQPEAVLGCAESNTRPLPCLHTALGVSSWGTELSSSISSPEFCFNSLGGRILSIRSGSGKEVPHRSHSRAGMLSQLPS